MSKIKAYIAAPFFSKEERHHYDRFIAYLREVGMFELLIPAEFFVPDGNELPNHEWAAKVFEHDVAMLRQADVVYALNYGMYSDTGTAWETGFAYALGIPVTTVLMDNESNFSLMCVNGSALISRFSDGFFVIKKEAIEQQ